MQEEIFNHFSPLTWSHTSLNCPLSRHQVMSSDVPPCSEATLYSCEVHLFTLYQKTLHRVEAQVTCHCQWKVRSLIHCFFILPSTQSTLYNFEFSHFNTCRLFCTFLSTYHIRYPMFGWLVQESRQKKGVALQKKCPVAPWIELCSWTFTSIL